MRCLIVYRYFYFSGRRYVSHKWHSDGHSRFSGRRQHTWSNFRHYKRPKWYNNLHYRVVIKFLYFLLLLTIQGEGSMSISNALGANTLDILLCLGLPWFIKSLMPASMNGGPVQMETNNLFFNCICMIISVFVLNIAAAVNGFKMYKMFGCICLIGHIVIITIFVFNGLNMKTTDIGQC